jgi:RNA polymerase sigma factor for flagellar operon FliA
MRPGRTRPYAAGSADIEERLRRHMPLVRRIARQLVGRFPANVELDDIVQDGMAGLLDALRRHDGDEGPGYEAYLGTRIRGAIYDALRRRDDLPRHMRQRLRHIETVSARLLQDGGTASEAEIAAACELSVEIYREALEAAASVPVVDELGEPDEPIDESADPLEAAATSELLARIETLLPHLAENERLVLALHYQQELSYTDIGFVMRLTPGRICQIHGQAMLRLRNLLDVKVPAAAARRRD